MKTTALSIPSASRGTHVQRDSKPLWTARQHGTASVRNPNGENGEDGTSIQHVVPVDAFPLLERRISFFFSIVNPQSLILMLDCSTIRRLQMR